MQAPSPALISKCDLVVCYDCLNSEAAADHRLSLSKLRPAVGAQVAWLQAHMQQARGQGAPSFTWAAEQLAQRFFLAARQVRGYSQAAQSRSATRHVLLICAQQVLRQLPHVIVLHVLSVLSTPGMLGCQI